MEAFLQLLSLLMLPSHCRSRPHPWVEEGQIWGRVGDQPKAANEAAAPAALKASFQVTAVSASADVIKPTSAFPSAPVTLEDGRWDWSAAERKTPT